MARINLLPWREERRRERQREFVSIMVGSLILTAVIMGTVHLTVAQKISFQQSRNDFLKAEVKKVDAKIREIRDLEKKKQQLIARMRVIETLQRNRPAVVHFFDELVRATPEGMYLKKLAQNGSRVTIHGEAQSNARVSAFMRNLDKSKYFENPQLKVIQRLGKKSRSGSRSFTLVVSQTSPESKKDDKSDKSGTPGKPKKKGA